MRVAQFRHRKWPPVALVQQGLAVVASAAPLAIIVRPSSFPPFYTVATDRQRLRVSLGLDHVQSSIVFETLWAMS